MAELWESVPERAESFQLPGRKSICRDKELIPLPSGFGATCPIAGVGVKAQSSRACSIGECQPAELTGFFT